MKGIFIAIISVALIICISLPCLAAGTEPYVTDGADTGKTAEGEDDNLSVKGLDGEPTDTFNMEEYLTEKIIPVILGVATSIVALLGGLGKIKSAASGLDKSGKELTDIKEEVYSTLSGLERQLKDGIGEIEERLSRIPEIKEGYDEIRESCERLTEQNKNLSEALRLGYEALPQAVKCGNARKIAILTDSEELEEAKK